MGYVMTALRVGFAAAFGHDDLEQAIVFAANLGGDADTNAAVTGALAGARFGAVGDSRALAGTAARAGAPDRNRDAPPAGLTPAPPGDTVRHVWETSGRRVIPGTLAACVAVLAGIGAWTLVHPHTPTIVQRVILLPAPSASAAVRPATAPASAPPPRRSPDPGRGTIRRDGRRHHVLRLRRALALEARAAPACNAGQSPLLRVSRMASKSLRPSKARSRPSRRSRRSRPNRRSRPSPRSRPSRRGHTRTSTTTRSPPSRTVRSRRSPRSPRSHPARIFTSRDVASRYARREDVE